MELNFWLLLIVESGRQKGVIYVCWGDKSRVVCVVKLTDNNYQSVTILLCGLNDNDVKEEVKTN